MTQQDEVGSTKQVERPLQSLGQFATALVNTVSKGTEREVRSYGLTPLDFALMRLFLTENEWTATQLAQILPTEVSGISRIVSKLVNRGLLQRRRPREDRRVVLLKLTEKGKALSLELHQKIHEFESALIDGISEGELDVFYSTVRKILSNHSSLTQSDAH